MIDEIMNDKILQRSTDEIQQVQTAHRVRLIQFWGIPEGANVLEIGCGQGDTTAALAYAVGEHGFVHGIDIAVETYGTPKTLGEAREILLKSKIGSRIRMDFKTDLMNDTAFSDTDITFDYVVFSHCAWYFQSAEELLKVLKKAKKIAKNLCFAEWDVRVQIPEQLTHYRAVMIQAQCGCFRQCRISNIRTLFTPPDLWDLAEQAGWTIKKKKILYSPDLQDGEWETNITIDYYPDEIRKLSRMPEQMKQLLLSEIDLLRESKKYGMIQPLSVFAFTAV